MKKIKLIICSLLLLTVFSMSNPVGAAPGIEKDKNIEISGSNDLSGCYYRDSSGNDTDNWTDEQCFEDETLRKKVYEALLEFYKDEATNYPNNVSENVGFSFTVTDTTLTTTNTNMRAILAGFRGDINAKWKKSEPKITSVKGIQFLTHAQVVDLRNNEIRDFTEVNKTTTFTKNHYGYAPGEDPEGSEARNVTWKIGGNAFEKLPYAFGGRLIIEAPQTTAFNYPDNEQKSFTFFRNTDETFEVSIEGINKCQIMKTEEDASGNLQVVLDLHGNIVYRNIKVVTINFVNRALDENHTADIDGKGIELDTTKGDNNQDILMK